MSFKSFSYISHICHTWFSHFKSFTTHHNMYSNFCITICNHISVCVGLCVRHWFVRQLLRVICPHICIYVWMNIYNSIIMQWIFRQLLNSSVCLSVNPFFCHSVSRIYLSECLSVCLSGSVIYLSVSHNFHLSVSVSQYYLYYLSVYLSVCLSPILILCRLYIY